MGFAPFGPTRRESKFGGNSKLSRSELNALRKSQRVKGKLAKTFSLKTSMGRYEAQEELKTDVLRLDRIGKTTKAIYFSVLYDKHHPIPSDSSYSTQSVGHLVCL